MAFESLSDKLQNVFKNLRSKGRLTEADVKASLKEVKMALLEADVNFKVVKQFINSVTERAVGQDMMNSLTPGQMVIKIVNEEMVALMGSETTEIKLNNSNELTVIMMAGLQGAGKTTTSAKIAGKLKAKGRKPLLVACDVYRPAAIKQLQVNGEKQGVPVFSMGDHQNPVDIAKAAIEHAKNNDLNVVILDTAGRLHVDETMMEELANIQKAIKVDQTIFVVDAMTGQDAVNVAKSFNEQIELDGVILTKMDGDTRGGAALSIRAVTGKPILYVGMGDILTLIDKAQSQIDEDKARELNQKIKKATFGYDDLLESLNQVKNMGGITDMLSMLPGVGSQLKNVEVDDSQFSRIEAIILSMTPQERANPDLINPSRKKRIAQGAGVDISEVNKLAKMLEQMKKMMKQFGGSLPKAGKRGKFKFPFSI